MERLSHGVAPSESPAHTPAMIARAVASIEDTVRKVLSTMCNTLVFPPGPRKGWSHTALESAWAKTHRTSSSQRSKCKEQNCGIPARRNGVQRRCARHTLRLSPCSTSVTRDPWPVACGGASRHPTPFSVSSVAEHHFSRISRISRFHIESRRSYLVAL